MNSRQQPEADTPRKDGNDEELAATLGRLELSVANRQERICVLARPKQPRILMLDKQKRVASMRAQRLRRAAAIASRRMKLAADNAGATLPIDTQAQLLDNQADLEYKRRTLHARWLHASRVYEQARRKTEVFLLSLKNDALFNQLTAARTPAPAPTASAASLPPI